MTAGKGDRRRPCHVSEEEFRKRWEQIDWSKKQLTNTQKREGAQSDKTRSAD